MTNEYDQDGITAHRYGDLPVRMAPLSDLDDFTVAEGYPDVRGWAVVAGQGDAVGKVHELIVDVGAMRTRYLDVTLRRDIYHLDADRDVLVPIGSAQLDRHHDYVVIDATTASRLAGLPPYTHLPLTREYENRVLSVLGETGAADVAEAEYYAGPHFDDSRFYARREGSADTAPDRERRPELREEVFIKKYAADDTPRTRVEPDDDLANPRG